MKLCYSVRNLAFETLFFYFLLWSTKWIFISAQCSNATMASLPRLTLTTQRFVTNSIALTYSLLNGRLLQMPLPVLSNTIGLFFSPRDLPRAATQLVNVAIWHLAYSLESHVLIGWDCAVITRARRLLVLWGPILEVRNDISFTSREVQLIKRSQLDWEQTSLFNYSDSFCWLCSLVSGDWSSTHNPKVADTHQHSHTGFKMSLVIQP